MFYFSGSFLPFWIRNRISNPDPLTRFNADQIRIRNPDLIRIQDAKKHVDPVDQDPDLDPYPQHCRRE